jgi:hypothetical protein
METTGPLALLAPKIVNASMYIGIVNIFFNVWQQVTPQNRRKLKLQFLTNINQNIMLSTMLCGKTWKLRLLT